VVAKEQRKLISVVLDHLPGQDLPMGFYTQQAADLSQWSGDKEDTEWRKFRREFEAKLMPRWVQQKLNDVDAELEGERAKRETAEAQEKSLRAQISKEAKVQQSLKGERDRALTEVGELRAVVEERDQALQAQIAKQVETEQGLKTERDRALADVVKLKATVEALSRARPNAGLGERTKRWLGPIGVGIVLLAAVAGAFVLFSPGRKAQGEAEAEIAELTATVNKFDRARQDAEAKATQAAAAQAKSEQARQAAEAKAAVAEKARQGAASRADDAEKASADAEKARQAAVQALQTVSTGQFSIKKNMVVTQPSFPGYISQEFKNSIGDCELNCLQSSSNRYCKAYSYGKASRICYTYSAFSDLVPNEAFDSGIRNQQ
jgi:hypothetical protein